MNLDDAFWVTPDSKLIAVSRKHINQIIDRPEKFGLTRNTVEQEYAKASERLGIEGQARANILLALLKRGWIRLRFDPRSYIWTIQLWSLSDKAKAQIFDLALIARQGNLKGGTISAITVLNARGKAITEGSIQDILNLKLFYCKQTVRLELTSLDDYVPLE